MTDSTPEGESAKASDPERVPSKQTNSENVSPADTTDSGYGSMGDATTQGSDVPQATFDRSCGKLFSRKVTKLKIYDKEIPKHVQERFTDLMELFDGQLCSHLSRSNCASSAISIRLKVLGESEATAKPWILIQCEEAISKRVRSFFNQRAVKMEFQPCGTDASLPSLEVLVSKRPPRPMASRERMLATCASPLESITLCGRAIRVSELGETRMATIGGIVKVQAEDKVSLYGLTAGHIVVEPASDATGKIDYASSEENEEYGDEGDEENVFLGEVDYELEVDGFDEQLDTRSATQCFIPSQTHEHWRDFGHVYATSNDDDKISKDFDWALIEMSDQSSCKPNLFVLQDNGHQFVVGEELRESARRSMKSQVGRPVVLLGGNGGVRWGTTTMTSFLKMSSTKSFIETYTIVLNDESDLRFGCSGSWVIDDVTHEVLGHAVASDELGGIHVVALKSILQQIEERLDADLVSLPTESELQMWHESSKNGSSIDQSQIKVATTGHSTATITPALDRRSRMALDVSLDPTLRSELMLWKGEDPVIHDDERNEINPCVESAVPNVDTPNEARGDSSPIILLGESIQDLSRNPPENISMLEDVLFQSRCICDHLVLAILPNDELQDDNAAKALRSCWRCFDRLIWIVDSMVLEQDTVPIQPELDHCEDFSEHLFKLRNRDSEIADSILRVCVELNKHLYNTKKQDLPQSFHERTLEFYIVMCHRLMRHRTKSIDKPTDNVLEACWALTEILFSIREDLCSDAFQTGARLAIYQTATNRLLEWQNGKFGTLDVGQIAKGEFSPFYNAPLTSDSAYGSARSSWDPDQ